MAENEAWQRIKTAREALQEMSATMTKESQDKFVKEIQALRKFSNNSSPNINKNSIENQIESMISEGYTIMKQEHNFVTDKILEQEGKNKERIGSLRVRKQNVKYNETKRRSRQVKNNSSESNFVNNAPAASAAASSAAAPLLPKSRFPNILNDITNNNNINYTVDNAKEKYVGDGDFFEFFKYNKSNINKYDFYFFRKSSSYVKLPPLPKISEEYEDENLAMQYDELLLVYNKISKLQDEYDKTTGPKRLVKEKIEVMRENYGFPILFKLTYYTLKLLSRKIEELLKKGEPIPVDLADKYQYVYWALWRRNKKSGLSNNYVIPKDEGDYFNKIRAIVEKVHPIFINKSNNSGNNSGNNGNNNNSGNNGNNNRGSNGNNNNSNSENNGNNNHNSNNTYNTSNNRKGPSRKYFKKAESKHSVSTRKSSVKEFNNNFNEAILPEMLLPEKIAKNKNAFVGKNILMSSKNIVNSAQDNVNNSELRQKGLTHDEMLKYMHNQAPEVNNNNNVVLPHRRIQANSASAPSSTNNNNNVVLPRRRIRANSVSAPSSTNNSNNNIVVPRRVVELAEYGNTTETETDPRYMPKRKHNSNSNSGPSRKRPRPNNKTRRARKH